MVGQGKRDTKDGSGVSGLRSGVDGVTICSEGQARGKRGAQSSILYMLRGAVYGVSTHGCNVGNCMSKSGV